MPRLVIPALECYSSTVANVLRTQSGEDSSLFGFALGLFLAWCLSLCSINIFEIEVIELAYVTEIVIRNTEIPYEKILTFENVSTVLGEH